MKLSLLILLTLACSEPIDRRKREVVYGFVPSGIVSLTTVQATAFGAVSTESTSTKHHRHHHPTPTQYTSETPSATAFGVVTTEAQTETLDLSQATEIIVVEATEIPQEPQCEDYVVKQKGHTLVIILKCKKGCKPIKHVKIIESGKCKAVKITSKSHVV